MLFAITTLLLAAVPAAWLVWCQRVGWRFSLRSLFFLTAVVAALSALVAWEGSFEEIGGWLLSENAEAPLLYVAFILFAELAAIVVFWMVGSVFFTLRSRPNMSFRRVADGRRAWRRFGRRISRRYFLWVPDSLWPVVFYLVFHASWMMLFPVLSIMAPIYNSSWNATDRSLCVLLHCVNAGFILLLLVDLSGQMWAEEWRIRLRHIPYLIALWLLGIFQLHIYYLPMYQHGIGTPGA